MSERLYNNPTPIGKVTVRVARYHPRVMPQTRDGLGGDIKIDRAWHIYVNSERTDFLVIDTWIARTILNHQGDMATCWHAGISAGDLARLAVNGTEQETYQS